MTNTYALILAGGSGTRFWPLSRNARPKQLLDLFKDTTLLNQTIDRLAGLIPKENILILTNKLQVEAVREVASDLPAENIFSEPSKRDTAPAVALGAALIAARNSEAVMVVLPADQLIKDVDSFHSVISDALSAASHSEALVTIGIKPTWACSSFGYIERGKQATISETNLTNPAHEVVRFHEKPDVKLAEQFIQQDNFSWNAGMFIWSIPVILKELTQHTPQLAEFMHEIMTSNDIEATVAAQFPELTPISIDYALMEKASRVLNIEATFDWDDVGSWISVSKHLQQLENNNTTNSPLVQIDSHNNIIFTKSKDTQVALLGVDDLIIVQTEDSILVANRHQADDIKKLVNALPDHLK